MAIILKFKKMQLYTQYLCTCIANVRCPIDAMQEEESNSDIQIKIYLVHTESAVAKQGALSYCDWLKWKHFSGINYL